MNPKTKKIVYGVVFAGATALLVPTLLDGRKPAPEPPPEVPADGPVAMEDDDGEENLARASVVPRLEVPAPVEEVTEPVERPAPRPEPVEELDYAAAEEAELEELAGRSELVGSLQESLGLLENFGPTAGLPDLDGMASSWSGAPTSGGDVGDGDPLITSSVPLMMDPLVEYLTANRLSGIIHGEDDQAAMVGGRIVRAGDELISGEAVVQSVERRHVVIAYRDQEVRVDLPPLRPRARPAASSGDSESSSEDGESSDDSSSPDSPTEGSDA